MGNYLQPITFCVVNYNGEKYLECTLRAVLLEMRTIDEIIVIDNCSTDQGISIVERLCPSARIVILDENRGPGVARNAGLLQATNNLILFIDNDVILRPNCSTQLSDALYRNNAAIAATPRVLYARNKSIIQFEGANSHYLGLMILRNANKKTKNCPKMLSKTNSLVTACFMLDSQRWGTCELFDDSFFFNYEDHDFGMRARILGHELLAVPNATVLHSSGTPGLSYRPGQDYSPTRVRCLIQNRWQIILKNYSLKTIILLMPCLFLYEIFQFAGSVKKGWFAEWQAALYWIVANNRRIIKRRRRVQKMRVCPDYTLLEAGKLPFTEDLTASLVERAAINTMDHISIAYWKLVRQLL